MEKDRSSKIIAIIALVIAVVGVSLGFAAYSQNLTISSTANVKGDESRFNVQFSTSQTEASSGSVEATLVPSGQVYLTASSATLTSTTINNLKATFTNGKGKQTATYSFYVYNGGELDAYLKKVTFEKSQPTCSATAGPNQATDILVQAACKDATIKITIDGDDYFTTNDVISSKKLTKKTAIPVKVVLEYNDVHPVDGDFDVDFGSITLNYSSSDGE